MKTKDVDIESREFQEVYRDLHSWVSDYRKDSDLNSLGAFAITGDFGDYFPHNWSCYDIHDILLKHGIAKKKTKCDHEYSCCYYYFSNMKSVEGFIYRFACFIVKRQKICDEYGLTQN